MTTEDYIFGLCAESLKIHCEVLTFTYTTGMGKCHNSFITEYGQNEAE